MCGGVACLDSLRQGSQKRPRETPSQVKAASNEKWREIPVVSSAQKWMLETAGHAPWRGTTPGARLQMIINFSIFTSPDIKLRHTLLALVNFEGNLFAKVRGSFAANEGVPFPRGSKHRLESFPLKTMSLDRRIGWAERRQLFREVWRHRWWRR